uniref:Uncharacterized protein LOC113795829 n=1 Tax=Dermatophagoides pteronyssinus TaxID=6956 RepID=A0A6P6YB66_DERPT|nr:uncharacterized protein LOC113795829 [Dermatophagoides pteronyssinus]
MLFHLKTYLYSSIKHIVEQYGTKQYRLLHIFEIISYIYWLIRLLLIFLMYLDPETFPFYQTMDYASAYIYRYRTLLNKFFFIIGIMMVLISILGIRTFFFHRVDTLSFQILYDCIVYNNDQYYKSLDTKENIQIKLSTRYNHYRQQFQKNYQYLSIINPLVDRLIWIRVWFDSWLQLDHVDKKLFIEQNKMQLFSHSSLKGRTQILLLNIFADKLIYLIHIIFGKIK